MPLGTNDMTITTGANFIPEIWMDEVREFLRANLVLANNIKLFPFEGKKGDTLHVPDVSELTTTAKAANTQVTLQSPTETEFQLAINRHRESSFLIEDLLAIQAAYDLRSEYTKSAGYAVAREIDSTLATVIYSLGNRIIGSTGAAFTTGAGTNNAAALAEAGIRTGIQTLDDANISQEGRCLLVRPVDKNSLLGISRFTEYQMIGPGGMPIRTGQFGEIFGVDVYVSTQPAATGTAHGNLLFQRDALALALQHSPRVQAQYKLEYLSWLFVVDVVYGYGIFRNNGAVGIYTPN